MSKNRVEAFSDGVFAIVITLLILNVHLDRHQALTLDALRNLASDVFAFVLSFVIVGVYWVAHHNMLHLIKAVDRRLLWLNLVLLLACGELDGRERRGHSALALCRIPPRFDG
jgi:uncharacterized membrane protein